MSRDPRQRELGPATERITARARELVREWSEALEQAGNGLLHKCGRARLERAFFHFLRAGRPTALLRQALAECPPEGLEEASRLLAARVSAEAPADEEGARLRAQALAFAASLRSDSPGGEPEEHLLRHTMRPTELLWHTAAALRAAKSAEAVGRALAEGAAALCEARSAVWWQQEGRALKAVAAADFLLPPEGLEFRPTGQFWKPAATQENVTELSPSRAEHAALLARLQARRGVVVRLREAGRWRGAVSVADGDFDAEHLDLLAAIAQQGAASLHALELEQAWEHAEHAPPAPAEEAGPALTSARGLEELLSRVCTLACAAGGGSACSLFLLEEPGRLRVRARHGLTAEEERDREPDLEAVARGVVGQGTSALLWLNEDRLRKLNSARLLAAGFRSALALRLAARAGTVGVLVLLTRDPASFGPRARREVALFAGQAGRALENMLRYESAQRRLTEMSDLTWASGRVAGSLDPDSIAQTISRAAADILNVPRVAIFLCDEEGGFWPLAKGQVGFSEVQTARLEPSGHVGADSLRTQATRAVEDAVREQQEKDPLVAWLGARSLVCAPMVAAQGLRGLLVIADDSPRVFGLHQITLLSSYANQAALALQSALLYQHAVEQVRRLSKLGELSDALAAATDPARTADLTLRAATEVLEAPVGLMWLVERPEEDLVLKAVQGLWPGEWAMQRLKPGEGLAGQAVQSSRTVVSADVTRDGRFMYRQQARLKGLGPAIATPLICRGRTVGVLNLYRTSPAQFTEEDRRLLSSLASLAAVSIENANLTREAQLRSEFVAAMMTEMNHRMRNSLQSVAGLLRMELERPQARGADEVVRRAISHVQAVAAVHEVVREQDIPFVDMKEAAHRVVRATHGLFREPAFEVQVSGTRVLLPSQKAISVALVMNELLDNAFRHGFAGRASGRVAISLAEVGGEVVLQVRDNGVGVPDLASLEGGKGLGLQIVRGLVEQELGGTVTFESRNGFAVRARFPKME